MKYDKDGLPRKEFYTEEIQKPYEEKLKAIKNQKYYTVGSIFLMFLVLIAMYFILN